eukprot:SAG31_NODE_8680_length_1407_cov_1.523700_1_plen_160_part_00
MFGRIAAKAAAMAEAATAAASELDNRYDLSGRAAAAITATNAAADAVSAKAAETMGDLDQKYDLSTKFNVVAAKAREVSEKAEAQFNEVSATVKVNLAISHVGIDPWADTSSGTFIVHPATLTAEGCTYDREPTLPAGCSNHYAGSKSFAHVHFCRIDR